MSRLNMIAAVLVGLATGPACGEPNAYVPNAGSGNLSIIATATDKIIATINVGDKPQGIASSVDGTRFYVSHDNGMLDEWDVYQKRQSGGVKLGNMVTAMDLNREGNLLAVAVDENSTVKLIDPATFRVTRTIAVEGKRPTNIVFSPDSRWIYASTETGSTVDVIDVAQGKVVKSISVGAGPRGAAFLPDGSRAYLAAAREKKVVVVDAASQAVLARVSTAGGPNSVQAHPDGKRVFVSAAGNGSVQVIDTTVNEIVAEFEACKDPSAMALTPDGRKLYVTCAPANEVAVIDTSTYKRIAQVAVGTMPLAVVVSEPPPPLDGRPPLRWQ